MKFYEQFIKGLKFHIQSETSLRNSFRGFHRGDDGINRKTRDSQISLFLRIPCAVSCAFLDTKCTTHDASHTACPAPIAVLATRAHNVQNVVTLTRILL